ncbi:MAG: hemolysin family protein [Balneolaceae bacterium]
METLDEPPSLYPDITLAADAALATVGEPITLVTWLVFVGVIIAGLILSALFSGSEVAFFSMANQMDKLDRDARPGGLDDRIIRMLQKPRRLLATILIGNTFANIVTSVAAAVLTGRLAANYGLAGFWVYAFEVVVLTFTILILSEITPKMISINHPLRMARRFTNFIYLHFLLLKPVAALIAESTLSLERRLPRPSNRMTTEDLRTMAEVGEKSGSIHGDEREIIENVIEFGHTEVREIMTSRVNIVAVSVDHSLRDVIELIRTKGYSRMPLYENDLDTIPGVIYAKDVLPYIHSDLDTTTINWRSIARRTLFIPATKKLDDLLRDFQQEKTHLAIVVDEYGGTEGLVTLDDILEEIVGEMGDEYDEADEKPYKRYRNGVWLFDAGVDLDDVEKLLKRQITTDTDEYETLGGLVYYLSERIPGVGERISYRGLELTVHSVRNNRIRKIRIQPLHPLKPSRGE